MFANQKCYNRNDQKVTILQFSSNLGVGQGSPISLELQCLFYILPVRFFFKKTVRPLAMPFHDNHLFFAENMDILTKNEYELHCSFY